MITPMNPPPDILARLREAGLRLTPATRQVLTVFASDPAWSPTHAEVHQALAQTGLHINRVTLYRLLDRLAACGVLHRHTDGDERAWRFTQIDSSDDQAWATRFECDACHRQFRLGQAGESTRAAADQLLKALAAMGHRGERVDVAIHGRCAGCEPERPHGQHTP
jgi:Fur family ferric uptake transcriptional regulator